jgi:hypothetical protein
MKPVPNYFIVGEQFYCVMALQDWSRPPVKSEMLKCRCCRGTGRDLWEPMFSSKDCWRCKGTGTLTDYPYADVPLGRPVEITPRKGAGRG